MKFITSEFSSVNSVIYSFILLLAIVVEGNQKAPFSIATTS